MKKKLLIAALVSTLALSFSALANCQYDGGQMTAEINQWGSITSNAYEDYYPIEIVNIDLAFESPYSGVCSGYANDWQVALGWEENNWGPTFVAVYVTKKSNVTTQKIAQAVDTMPHAMKKNK